MPRRGTKNCQTRQTATASTPEGEFKRHLADLELATPEAYRVWCRENGFSANQNKTWQERRNEVHRAQKLQERASEQTRLAQHILALQFETERAYESWCRENGLDVGGKSVKQCRQEQAARDRERAQNALARTRKQARNPRDIILALFEGTEEEQRIKTPYLQKIARLFAAETNEEVRASLRDLLLHVHSCARLFGPEPVIAALGYDAGNTFLEGMHMLARHHSRWLRSPETWRPATHNAHRQFGALARHLLARYPLPASLDCVWFEGETARAQRHQDWFLHVASGQNIRVADIPIPLTKSAAHHFLLAPPDFLPEAALRWGQVIALGGGESLARALIATRLGRDLETLPDPDFWQSVVHFFINNPMLDTSWIGPMVDFIYDRKFTPREEIGAEGEMLVMEPIEPTFSMKGRTPAALARRVEEWHQHLARDTRRAVKQWQPCGIGGFDALAPAPAHDKPVRWLIVELLDSLALKEEGKTMHHCVASYDRSCLRGQTSIWSLRMEDVSAGTVRNVMTIEVNNATRTVTQAKGRCNKGPGDKRASERLNYAPQILKQWAAQEHIIVPGHIF